MSPLPCNIHVIQFIPLRRYHDGARREYVQPTKWDRSLSCLFSTLLFWPSGWRMQKIHLWWMRWKCKQLRNSCRMPDNLSGTTDLPPSKGTRSMQGVHPTLLFWRSGWRMQTVHLWWVRWQCKQLQNWGRMHWRMSQLERQVRTVFKIGLLIFFQVTATSNN